MKKIKTALFLAAFFMMFVVATDGKFSAMAYAAEAEEDVVLPEFEYMQLAPVMLPVITDKGISQQVSLFISLEVPYGTTGKVENLRPRLADAYLQDLYGIFSSGQGMTQAGAVNVKMVKDRLTRITKNVLGDQEFNDVLLEVIQQRPM